MLDVGADLAEPADRRPVTLPDACARGPHAHAGRPQLAGEIKDNRKERQSWPVGVRVTQGQGTGRPVWPAAGQPFASLAGRLAASD